MSTIEFKIIEHSNKAGDVYYTAKYKDGWRWQTVQAPVCGGEFYLNKSFETIEDAIAAIKKRCWSTKTIQKGWIL